MTRLIRLASFLVLLAAQVFLVSAALAASKAQSELTLDVSQGRLLTLPGDASSVFLADPAIADVQVPTPNKVFIFGKKPGRTTLYALAANGTTLANYSVQVGQGVGAAQAAVAAVPAGNTKLTATDNGLMLHGTVPDASTAYHITNTAAGYIANKAALDTTELKVEGSQQVMLRVWIGEVDRTVTKDLGFNWSFASLPGLGTIRFITGRQAFPTTTPATGSAANGGFNDQITGRGLLDYPPGDFGSIVGGFVSGRTAGNAVIDALASEGLITTLAEPTLTALSGESASFLAGGQFPIPIAQGFNAVSITFQTYGVSLSFVPTVLAPNRISLKVAPEVSELTTQGEVSFSGATIPGLTVRRAETTVELGSGQSFAIAGLLQNTTSTTIQSYPGLGDLPVLGALFRSNNFQRGESELVIIITPYLVRGVDDPNRLQLPTDGLSPPSDLERIFRARMAVGASASSTQSPTGSVSVLTGPHLAGDAGFDLE